MAGPTACVAICHDLTSVRQLETEIARRDQFFASILRNSADAIFTLDPEERITSWNKGAEAIFGFTEEEMLGQSLEVLLPQHLKEQRRTGEDLSDCPGRRLSAQLSDSATNEGRPDD